MYVEPQNEHRWLLRLIGDWTFENEAKMGPDQPPMKFTGSESVRSLGDVWVLCEGRGETPGGGVGLTLMTLGYDPAKKRFVGSFIGSMMTHLWPYDGQLDGDVLTLNSEGPGMTPDAGLIKYKDVIELKSDDHRVLTSHMQQPDGSFFHFMTAHYRRVKK